MFRVSILPVYIENIILEVCQAIYFVLNDYIKVPNIKEWEDILVGFNDRWNFPRCCGAIDGKHIAIKAPSIVESIYKNTNSIILLAIVDHNCCLRYIDGRNADSGIFQC